MSGAAVHPPRQRSPLVEMIILAAPTVATMTSFTLMQFVDKLMVSRIGPDPIYVGAQGNGGLVSWVLISILTGLITMVNTYVSQNLGAGKPERAPAYAWNGLWLSAAYWAVVMIPFALALPWVFGVMRSADAANAAQFIRRDQLATGYARILMYGSLVAMSARAIAQYFYGMHKPTVVLVAGVAGNVTNLVFNSLFIYGPAAPKGTGIAWIDSWFAFTASFCSRLGWSAHGLDGAAYATVIGSLVEFLIPMAVFLSPRYIRRFSTTTQWRPSLSHMRDLYKIGWPNALMFGNEMVCWAFFMVYLVGHFGTMHSTAGWIAHQWMSMSFMPSVGISVAITASVGKCMGMGRPDLAAQRAWTGLRLAVGWMTLCAVVFVLFRHELTEMFVEPTTPVRDRELIIRLGAGFLIATAAFQFFDGVAMSLSGALRGAGDTRFPSLVTLVLSWTLIVGGGLALVNFAPQLESLGPWIAAASYIITLAVVILARFLGGKWRQIKLLQPETGVSPIVPAAAEGEPIVAGPGGK